jgi:hypothetical protein
LQFSTHTGGAGSISFQNIINGTFLAPSTDGSKAISSNSDYLWVCKLQESGGFVMFVPMLKPYLHYMLNHNSAAKDTFAQVITYVPGYGEISLTPKLSTKDIKQE